MERIITLRFFRSSHQIRRPLLVLCKASLYFRALFEGNFLETNKNTYTFQDFTFEEFSAVLSFIDDPFQSLQPFQALPMTNFLALEKSEWKEEENVKEKVVQNTFQGFLDMDNMNFVPNAILSKAVYGKVVPILGNQTQRQVSQTQPGKFQLSFPSYTGNRFLLESTAHNFIFFWPCIHDISLDRIVVSEIRNTSSSKKEIFSFKGNQCSLFEKRGTMFCLLPVWNSHGSPFYSQADIDLEFEVFCCDEKSSRIKLCYTSSFYNLNLLNQDPPMMEYPLMFPAYLGTLSLDQKMAATRFTVSDLCFNHMVFRISTKETRWTKDHLPFFQSDDDVRLVVRGKKSTQDQKLEKRAQEMASFRRKLNDLERRFSNYIFEHPDVRVSPFADEARQLLDDHFDIFSRDQWNYELEHIDYRDLTFFFESRSLNPRRNDGMDIHNLILAFTQNIFFTEFMASRRFNRPYRHLPRQGQEHFLQEEIFLPEENVQEPLFEREVIFQPFLERFRNHDWVNDDIQETTTHWKVLFEQSLWHLSMNKELSENAPKDEIFRKDSQNINVFEWSLFSGLEDICALDMKSGMGIKSFDELEFSVQGDGDVPSILLDVFVNNMVILRTTKGEFSQVSSVKARLDQIF
jgi:hypothetical protein